MFLESFLFLEDYLTFTALAMRPAPAAVARAAPRPARGPIAAEDVWFTYPNGGRAALRRDVAVVFQDFLRYWLRVRDNIAMGRHERFDDDAGVVGAARRAGAD